MTDARERRGGLYDYPITPKTPSEFFKTAKIESFEIRKKVAGDTVLNAREVAPDLEWDFALDNITFLSINTFGNPKRHRGQNALVFMVGLELAGISRRMNWDMDSPQLVYISSFFIQETLKERADSLGQNVENAPNRKFISEDARTTLIGKERETLERLREFCHEFTLRIKDFASRFLPSDIRYLRILQALPFADYKLRPRILHYLLDGRIKEAYDVIDAAGL
ncbi:MAG: hypothetical protein A2958_00655 [Candidatus Levybacteria bacterium RIFCSPLOWO2_01_FULL_38_13]|nr:MAG: hypothetical protein A2629_00550 [Candidatus Levybacteria bacterium RIFCSPHIGHO2_01_FULL_41_15]OGH34797.1 MAG: hypothetical protein A2958_00655 [Candidatus Levybacteria bacterium RIFCSPLOWO2_01_FULL_38_13]